jgi:hypothetical protein
VLCREYGVFQLSDHSSEHLLYSVNTYSGQLFNYFLNTTNIAHVLDIVELCFVIIDGYVRENPYLFSYGNLKIKQSPDQAISELNDRFKEHGIGYQFESGKIIRIDSTLIHNEVTKPTLTLLNNPKFQGAQEEYLKAHEHYRYNRNKECLNECLKAFESTLKIICTEKQWNFSSTDTAKKLIDICFDNGLVPQFLQTQFNSLKNLFESGIPTIRNKTSGHGQGQTSQPLDDKVTKYVLNLIGVNIIFLIEKSEIK